MKIKQTIIALALMIGISSFAISPVSYAAEGDQCGNTTLKAGESCCGGVPTSIISCNETNDPNNPNNNAIFGILRLIINILTAGVGLVAVGGLLYASYEYISNKGDPAVIKSAKDTITNVVIGLIAYAIMWSLLEFLIPGGSLNNVFEFVK